MPKKDCEIFFDPDTGKIRFVRALDRLELQTLVGQLSQIVPVPTYAHFLALFKESVREAFRVEKGEVVLADEGRLTLELVVFCAELVEDFRAQDGAGIAIATHFLAHLLAGKFDVHPNLADLQRALEALVETGSHKSLEDFVRGSLAASAFPRLSRSFLSRLFG